MSLPKPRLIALGRDVDIAVPPRANKEAQVKVLVHSGRLGFRELMRRLDRDELRAICRAHGLDDSGRARQALAARLMQARGGVESAPPRSLFPGNDVTHLIPKKHDIVLCRHRQWLVEGIVPARDLSEATQVHLSCLDDDNQGRRLTVLWELELGARVHRPDAHGLGEIKHIDPPRHFGAYLSTLRWNMVTATEGRLFQAPFRAGIALKSYQLVPLQKALELPRANLFIADDVGLGKTIEAGLVLSELSLRQRVDFCLVVCPAGVTLQWREELQRRFGMRFEVMSRAFVARRRKERGFGVNPWSTHARFIVSHQLLRRPEYREQLFSHLGDRTTKSLLILDEAHAAAPASSSKYAIDSDLTHVMRHLAPRFENRLFLSATPHNGHSNSFSALLELLDPQRFTRGVTVNGDKQLQTVMVRRLKQDLRETGLGDDFPERHVVQLELSHERGEWFVRERRWDRKHKSYEDTRPHSLGAAEPFELQLEQDLAHYTSLVAAKGRGRLVFINLQKRLLSSVEAFARTLRVHARSLERKDAKAAALAADSTDDSAEPTADEREEAVGADEEHGPDDETLAMQDDGRVANASRALPALQNEARKQLEALLAAAERDRVRPDAKLLALIDWIRRHQCPGVQVPNLDSRPPGAAGKRSSTKTAGDPRWSDRRLIIFTEYGDTKRYLLQLLSAAIQHTEQADDRILQLHGGMSDEAREEVRNAFNSQPSEHPVRILLATDAAREGINLQGHCADIIHFDVPWNPARLEQRNGRIDRTLQREPDVYCRYFSYRDREADPVLATLVEKVEVISRELGSLGAVVAEDIGHELDAHGVTTGTRQRIEQLSRPEKQSTVNAELESTRALARMTDEVHHADSVLQDSRKRLRYDSTLLREVVNVGLELSGAGALTPHAPAQGEEPASFTLPTLPDSWQATLDTVRPERKGKQTFWDFRNQPPLPVSFEPSPTLDGHVAQLHLQHPVVQRVLSRFIAQGYSNHELSRVTIVRNKRDSLVRVIAFGRLSLFGQGAARLHDELIAIAARWFDGKDQALKPFADEGDKNAIALLEEILREAPSLAQVPKTLQQRVVAAAPGLFEQLWKPLREEADARAGKAVEQLKARGHKEAGQLASLITTQKSAIERRLREHSQLDISELDKQERAQREAEARHIKHRLESLDKEIQLEPEQIKTLYEVALHRLTPVGLVVLWPSTRS